MCMCTAVPSLLHLCSYSLYHLTRKSFSNVKSVMQVALSPSNHTEYPNLYPTHIWDSEQFFASPVSVCIHYVLYMSGGKNPLELWCHQICLMAIYLILWRVVLVLVLLSMPSTWCTYTVWHLVHRDFCIMSYRRLCIHTMYILPMQDAAGLLFGYIDSTLLFCYAIGLFLSGWIGDRYMYVPMRRKRGIEQDKCRHMYTCTYM